MAGIKKQHENARGKDGNLKPKYKDQPRFKTIFGYEDAFTDSFEKLSKQMAKDVVRQIATLAGVTKKQ